LPAAAQLDHLRVVLVSARNPLNIGAAARAMSNFGCLYLRLVNPYKVAFREARSAVGATRVLAGAEEFENVAAAVADCSLVVGTTLARVALLFGSEKTGLSNEDLGHCHWLLRIPTRDQHISMNLGQAVAVCLYELVRDAKVKPERAKIRAASSGELERITTLLFELLQVSGYTKPRVAQSSEMKTRRMIRRLHLGSDDAEILQGMLRQILWKLRSSGQTG
jgi:tRNA C32,U32 (ribose-2'-O)-methylase TrmJ